MTDRERNINTMIGLTAAGVIVTIVVYATYGPLAGGVAVILAGDLYPAGLQVHDRVIASPMSEF